MFRNYDEYDMVVLCLFEGGGKRDGSFRDDF